MVNTDNVSLVTGGAGFIGSELVRQLLDEGATVIVYDNFSFGQKSNLPDDDNVIIVEGDIRDPDKLKKTFKEHAPAKIFHMAALHFIPYCLKNPQETISVNVEGTLNVLEACKGVDVRSVVIASTAAVYAIQDTPHSETDTAVPVEVYGASKLFDEYLLRIFHKETGVKSAAARLFNGFGRRETNPHVIPDILGQLSQGDKIELGNIEPKRDFIHTADISRALRLMADNDDFGFDIFNVGTGTEFSVRELVDIIAKILDKPLEIISVDSRKRKVERYRLIADISKIRSKLGWEQKVPLREGCRDILESIGRL